MTAAGTIRSRYAVHRRATRRVETWDSVFVRARRTEVHGLVGDVSRWGQWWPRALGDGDGAGDALVLVPPTWRARLRRRRQRVAVEVTKDRPGLGLRFCYRGDLTGECEFFYTDADAGTMVHHIARIDVPRRGWMHHLGDHRAVMRATLDELKDRLEGTRLPGAEPDPALLADQVVARMEYQRGVDAFAARQVHEQTTGSVPAP